MPRPLSPNSYVSGHWHTKDARRSVGAASRIDTLAGHAIALENLVHMLFVELKDRIPADADELIERVSSVVEQGAFSDTPAGKQELPEVEQRVERAYYRALKSFVEGLD